MSKSYGAYKKPKNIFGELKVRRDMRVKTGSAILPYDTLDAIFYSSVRNSQIDAISGVEVVVMETPSEQRDSLLDGRTRIYSTVTVYITRYDDATASDAASVLSEIKELYPLVVAGATLSDSSAYKSAIGDTTNTAIYGSFVESNEYRLVVGTPSYETPTNDPAALDSPHDGSTYGRQDGEWVSVVGGGGGDVSSVFGRTGIIEAANGDYLATQVTNNSGTAGSSVGAALTSLQSAINGKATTAQGALADTAVQPADLASVATSGQYSDLVSTPTLGTAAATSISDYATASQGVQADSAVQPGDAITNLTNNANYITAAQAPVQTVAGRNGAVVLSTADLTDFDDSDYTSSADLASLSVSQGASLVGVHDSAGHYASFDVEGVLAEVAVELDSLQGVNFFAPVRVHTVTNNSLNGTSNVDGISISQGDRVLVEVQDNPEENGIYVASSSAWTRATDADTAGEFILNKTCYVEAGNTGAGKTYALTVVPTTLDTDAVTWTEKFQINNSVGAGSIGTTELATNAVTYSKLDTELQADIDKTELITVTGSVNLDSDFATAAQGATADSATQPGDNISTLTNDASYITAASAPVQTVAGRTGTVVLTKADVGLSNVDNTSDTNKPVSTAQQTILDGKANVNSPSLTGTPTAPTPAADDNSNKIATTAFVQTEIAGLSGGGAGFEVKPTVTPVDLPTVDQGITTLATQTADTAWPGMVWYFYDYTGTPGTYNRSSETGAVGLQENVPGTYTLKTRAAWPFGISDEATINVIINAFTLTRTTMFGGLDGLQYSGSNSSSSGWTSTWVAVEGAVAYDSGSYTFDKGSINADTANCLAFWNYTTQELVAFKYGSGEILSAAYKWSSIATLPAQGDILGNSSALYASDSSQRTAANNSSILGKRYPSVAYYYSTLGATKCLEVTAAGTEFHGFGDRSTNWSYGFRLADDWVSTAGAQQMLSGVGSANYFVNAIAGWGLGASPYEYIHYGDFDSGAYNTSTNGTTWNISTNNWVIGNAGDLVVVTFDGGGTDTFKIYVEGTLIYSSTDVDTYMATSSTPTALRFGDVSGSNNTGYPTTYNKLTSWYSRLDSLFVTVGTAYSQAQVTEITADKADLSLSDNYASMTTLAEFDDNGVTNVKGSASYGRHTISFA